MAARRLARSAALVGGAAVLAAALAPPLHERAEELLSAHMVQHLLISLVAPPLLLAGRPLSLALRTLPPPAGRALLRALHGRPVAALARPGPGWAAFTLVLLVSHAPPVYDAAVRSAPLHALEHAFYLSAAVLFWLPVLSFEPLPRRSSPLPRVLAVLAAMPPMALLGLWLIDASHELYPVYGQALADQHLAGELMWIGGNLPLAFVTLAVAWSALRREEQRQRLREVHAR